MNATGLDISTEVLAVVIAVVTILFTTIIFLISRRRKRGKVVALVGLCDAGKTLLLSRVRSHYLNSSGILLHDNIDSEWKICKNLHQHD